MAKNQITSTEKKILNSMYWRSGCCFATFNMVKMEGNAFTLTMAPAINEIFKDDSAGHCCGIIISLIRMRFSCPSSQDYALRWKKKEKKKGLWMPIP